jgi:hypothetical protein
MYLGSYKERTSLLETNSVETACSDQSWDASINANVEPWAAWAGRRSNHGGHLVTLLWSGVVHSVSSATKIHQLLGTLMKGGDANIMLLYCGSYESGR